MKAVGKMDAAAFNVQIELKRNPTIQLDGGTQPDTLIGGSGGWKSRRWRDGDLGPAGANRPAATAAA